MARRKRKYKTGTHYSPKCLDPINYRSGWEFECLKHLDHEENVISYKYECFKIPYISNERTKKIRNYIPDFYVIYSDGKEKVIEVKRKDKILEAKTAKKLKAGEEWCKANSKEFEVWQNEHIKIITLLNQQRGLTPWPMKKTTKKKKPRNKTKK